MAGAACAILAASFSTTAFGDGAAAVSMAAKDLVALMRERSPGERTSGELVKSKQPAGKVAHQRALSRTRKAAPPLAAVDDYLPEVTLESVPLAMAGAPMFIDSPELGRAVASPRSVGGPGGGGFIGPIGGGGGGGGGGSPPPDGEVPPPEGGVPPETPIVPPVSTVPPPGDGVPPIIVPPPPGEGVPPPPVSAVPEPSTWLMMMMGFGAVGFSIRRKRRTFDGVKSIVLAGNA